VTRKLTQDISQHFQIKLCKMIHTSFAPPIFSTSKHFFLSPSSNSSINSHPPIFKQGTYRPKPNKMCQETHYKYNCNDKHTKCIGVEKKCHLSWAPHGKVKMIRGYINGPCEDCSRIFLTHPSRQTYTIIPATPVVYTPALTPAPVIVNPAQTILIPAPQPAQITPTLPQQTPGPGSAGAPLDVPKGWIITGGWNWMKSKNCYEYVVHYKKDPAAPATNRIPANKQGFNTIHGADPGPLPPGWGAQTNPFPAKTGFNTTHGADPGPPPPGSKFPFPIPCFRCQEKTAPLSCIIV
jgi:hypothetical protein